MKFLIKHALGGGFGGVEMTDGEILEFENEEEAMDYAWEMACEDYESYAGLHGLRDHSMIIEEEGIDTGNSDDDYAEADSLSDIPHLLQRSFAIPKRTKALP